MFSRNFVRVIALITWIFVGLPATIAMAQAPVATDPDSVRRLPAIEVKASILPGRGGSIGSGGGAMEQSVPLTAAHAQSIGEIAARLAGLTLYDDLGSRSKLTVTGRGFAASPVVGLPQGISVFIDGVPLNEPDAGQVNFDLVPMQQLRELEILGGTASLLGPYTLGGAINLLTYDAGELPPGDLLLTIGSHGIAAATARVSAAARGWDLVASAASERGEGWRQQTGSSTGNLFLEAGRRGASRSLSVQLYGARARASTAGSLPLGVYAVRPDSNLTPGDFELLSQGHLALHAGVAGERHVGVARLWVRAHEAERFNVNQVDDPDVRSFSSNQTLGVHADWRTRLRTPAGQLAARAALGGSLNATSVRIFAERLEPGLTTDVSAPISRLDGFLGADHTIGRVQLSIGLRQDVIRIPFRNRLRPERDTTSSYAQLSPRAGAIVSLTRQLRFFASLGRSFRAPAVIELACADPEEPCPLPFALGDDPPLDPVRASTREIGAAFEGDRLTVRAAAFRTDVRDDIFLLPYEEESEPSGSTIDGYFANIARTRREGVEVMMQGRHPGGHSVWARYALTHATFRIADVEIFSVREHAGAENEIEVGDRLPLVPAHAAAAGVSVKAPGGFGVAVDAQYVGRRYLRGDEANEELPLPSHTLLNAGLSRSVGSLEVELLVRNLGNARHATFGTFNLLQSSGTVERFLTPGEPRTLTMSVRRAWR
jgi:iron complex outermembrane recepter protein